MKSFFCENLEILKFGLTERLGGGSVGSFHPKPC